MALSFVQLCVLSVIFGFQVIIFVTAMGNEVMCRPASVLE